MKKNSFKGACHVEDVVTKAITIRLFDKSTWSNLGNGLFFKLGTEKKIIKSIRFLYPKVRVVTWNDCVIAKRPKEQTELKFLTVPLKLKHF